jgi:hypothetical protein
MGMRRAVGALGSALLLGASGGCYHYTFRDHASGGAEVQYSERRPTYLNGFVGNGVVDTQKYCARPTKTELRVTASDVAIAAATLLIYTPHTLYVSCPVPGARL